MERIKKVFIAKTAIRLLAGSISLASGFGIGGMLKHKPEVISWGTYDAVSDSITFEDNDNVFRDFYVISDICSRDTLKQIKKLTIDLKTTDIADLEYMPNIEELTISSFGHMSDEDKEILANIKTLKKLVIVFDESMYNRNTWDLSWIDRKVDISLKTLDKEYYIGLNNIFDSDYYRIYLYNVVKNIDSINNGRVKYKLYDKETTQRLEEYSQKLDTMLLGLDLDNTTDEEEKIVRIVNAVTDLITYDPKVKEVLDKEQDDDNKQLDLVFNTDAVLYNRELITSVYDNDDRYGICCNYAAFTSLLAGCSDIDLSYAISSSHAWCQYHKNGKTYIVDPTILDNRDAYNNLKNNIFELSQTTLLNLLKDEVIMEPTDVYTARKEIYLSNKDAKFERDVKYLNWPKEAYKDQMILYAVILAATLVAFKATQEMYKYELEAEEEKKKEKQL